MDACLVIGVGAMGSALVRGGLGSGAIDGGGLCLCDPAASALEPFAREVARATTDLEEAMEWLGAAGSGAHVLLAVKPQHLGAVAGVAASRIGGRPVTSILAGVTSARVRAALGGQARVIRAMPNLPASIGRGATCLAVGAGAHPGDERWALALFQSVGRVFIDDESMMDAFTALAGSGPAYVFHMAEALAAAGERMGYPRERSREIVEATIHGAAELLRGSDPEELRRRVTSKGGTTEAALGVLADGGFVELVASAVMAARARGAILNASAV